MLTVNDLIPPLHLSSQFAAAAWGNIFYVDDYSCFPLLSWMIFPAVGYALASVLRDASDKDLFWKRVIAVHTVVLVAVTAIAQCPLDFTCRSGLSHALLKPDFACAHPQSHANTS